MNSFTQKRIAALSAKHDEERSKLDREMVVISQLPNDLPEPRFVHVGSKLYGSVASLEYGNTYRRHFDDTAPPRELQYALPDAVALLRTIGEIMPYFTVKGGCLAMKPEDAITDDERARSIITGPYACKIVCDAFARKLEAFVTLASGQLVRVSIVLDQSAKLGHWSRVPGTGRDDRPNDWQYTKAFAEIGQDKTVSYGGGSRRGDGSKGQMVYCFTFVDGIKTGAEQS